VDYVTIALLLGALGVLFVTVGGCLGGSGAWPGLLLGLAAAGSSFWFSELMAAAYIANPPAGRRISFAGLFAWHRPIVERPPDSKGYIVHECLVEPGKKGCVL
jgi:hypothetical protein